jgi:hypothetical protein
MRSEATHYYKEIDYSKTIFMWCKARIGRKRNQTRVSGLTKLGVMLGLALMGLLLVAWIVEAKILSEIICNEDKFYQLTTFQCHCPKQWLVIRANGFITRNPNRIPPCDGEDYWIMYPVEILLKYLVAAVFAPLRLAAMLTR